MTNDLTSRQRPCTACCGAWGAPDGVRGATACCGPHARRVLRLCGAHATAPILLLLIRALPANDASTQTQVCRVEQLWDEWDASARAWQPHFSGRWYAPRSALQRADGAGGSSAVRGPVS